MATSAMLFNHAHSASRHRSPGHPHDTGGGHIPTPLNPADIPVGGRLNLLLTAPSWRQGTWADRLPPLLDPMGIRSVRAQTARQAERVIRQTTVHIAVVDLSLPLDEARDPSAVEEGGPRILELLARLASPPPTVVIQTPRGHRDATRCMSAALRCGAFAVVDRSAADIELLLDVMRRVLNRFYASRWPGGPDADPNPRRAGRLYEDPRKGPGMV